MATFNIHYYPSHRDRGALVTKKANDTVLMGALVKMGSTAGDVEETAASTDKVIGVAIVDESYAAKNTDSDGNAQEQYEDNDPVVVELLTDGVVLNLLNSGTDTISENSWVEPAADGKIATGSTDPIGITLKDIAGSARGPVMIQRVRNEA